MKAFLAIPDENGPLDGTVRRFRRAVADIAGEPPPLTGARRVGQSQKVLNVMLREAKHSATI